MKLIDLNPDWVSHEGRHGEGLACDCPCGCDSRLWVPFANPIDGLPKSPEISGWQRTGETFETLTLSPSIWRKKPGSPDGCGWHGFLTNGEFRSV